jgi:hypothetical protein
MTNGGHPEGSGEKPGSGKPEPRGKEAGGERGPKPPAPGGDRAKEAKARA